MRSIEPFQNSLLKGNLTLELPSKNELSHSKSFPCFHTRKVYIQSRKFVAPLDVLWPPFTHDNQANALRRLVFVHTIRSKVVLIPKSQSDLESIMAGAADSSLDCLEVEAKVVVVVFGMLGSLLP